MQPLDLREIYFILSLFAHEMQPKGVIIVQPFAQQKLL